MGLLNWFTRKSHSGDDCEITSASTPQELEQILRQAYGGTESASGIHVGVRDALQQPSFLASAKVLSETIAQLPLRILLEDDCGNQKEPRRHSLKRIFRDGPNEFTTVYEWIETMVLHMILSGNEFNFIVRNSSGQVVELLPLPSGSVKVDVLDFRFRYTVSDSAGAPAGTFGPDQILHIKSLSLDALVGLNSLGLQKEALGLALSAEKQTGKGFKNGSRLSGVLEHPGTLEAEAADRLRERWEHLYSGIINTGKTVVLEEGMQWKPTSQTGKDSQQLETRKYQRQEIAAMNRVPAHMVGDFSGGLKANVEEQNREFHTLTLLPWLRRIEQRFEKQLLNDRERSQYVIRFNTAAFLRGDTKSRYGAYKDGILTGFLTRNEARTLENLPQLTGLDEPLQPLNMEPVAATPEGEGDCP